MILKNLFFQFFLFFFFLFSACGGQGTTRVGNPESNNTKPTKNIYLDPLNNGDLRVRMNIEVFGETIDDLKEAYFDIIVNNGEKEFLENKAFDYYDSVFGYVIFIIKNVRKQSTVDIKTYSKDNVETYYQGEVSDQTQEAVIIDNPIQNPQEEIPHGSHEEIENQEIQGEGAGEEENENNENENCVIASEVCDQEDNDCDGHIDEKIQCSQLSLGTHHACFLSNDFHVSCWGSNEYGQLGNGTNMDSNHPIPINHSPNPEEELQFYQVSSGASYSCGIDQNKKIWCWGKNDLGQLGTGNYNKASQATPINEDFFRIENEEALFTQISSGSQHSCAITINNKAWCWGSNESGQLGSNINLYDNSHKPIRVIHDVAGIGDEISFQQIYSGSRISCAIDLDQKIWCWGNVEEDPFDQGFLRTTPQKINHTPQNAISELSFMALGVKNYNDDICAIDLHQKIWCWNQDNPFAPPNSINDSPPESEEELFFSKISSGYNHLCTVSTAQEIWCYGDNFYGQLGNGAREDSNRDLIKVNSDPLNSGKPLSFIEVDANLSYSCALTADQKIWCWGKEAHGKLGNGDQGSSLIPSTINEEDIENLGAENRVQNIQEISLGSHHACALDQDGQIWCWGDNFYGQLGNHSFDSSFIPKAVIFEGENRPASFLKISSSPSHTCAIDNNSQAWCWGYHLSGKLGNPSRDLYMNHPMPVSQNDILLQSISSGNDHSCSLDTNQRLWCWGSNGYVQLANRQILGPQRQMIAAQDFDGEDNKTFIEISSADYRTCGLDTDHYIWCWGKSYSNNERLILEDPENPGQEIQFRKLAIGSSYLTYSGKNCAIDLDQKIWCWNINDDNRDFRKINHNPPGNDSGEELNFTQIALAPEKACALDENHEIWCWGNDRNGFLGTGLIQESEHPVKINHQPLGNHQEPLRFRFIDMGEHFACALTLENEAWCWGFDGQGQLGNTSFTNQYIPSKIYQMSHE